MTSVRVSCAAKSAPIVIRRRKLRIVLCQYAAFSCSNYAKFIIDTFNLAHASLAITKLASTRMSTKLAQPKPRMSSEERRAAIVHAACRLFAERGFRGTTTRELAAAVGVTEPVLYEHFRTKRDLYSAIIGEKAKAGITA